MCENMQIFRKGDISMKKCYSSSVDFSYFKQLDVNIEEGCCNHKYEILYVVSGSGFLTIEGTQLEINNNCFYLIKPLTYHAIHSDNSEMFEYYSMSFGSDDISSHLSDFLVSCFSEDTPCVIIEKFDNAELGRILSGLAFADKLSGEIKNQYYATLISQILVILSYADSKISHSNSNEMVSNIIDFIFDNLDEGKAVTLDELAKTFFVSKFYLCRAFKKHKGISIHSYINQRRVMLAKEYIDSGISALEASERVGYADYSAFYRAYVKVVGQSPKS